MTHDVFDWTKEWADLRGIKIWTSEETASTNTIAKNDETLAPSTPSISELSEPSLYLTRRQTAGRGRNANAWETAPGAFLSSWSFRVGSSPQPILAPLAGLALYEALGSVFSGLRLGLKAPNDLFSNNKKIAGLLIETVVTGADIKTVIGLGMNVQEAPMSVPTAGSIGDVAHVDRNLWLGFLDAWRAKLAHAVQQSLTTQLAPDARERLRDALNMRPGAKDRVVRIGAHGEIETLKGFVHWHQL